jgi:hypothetical protein
MLKVLRYELLVIGIILLLASLPLFYFFIPFPAIKDYRNAVNNEYASYTGVPLSIERHYGNAIPVDVNKQINVRNGIYAIHINNNGRDVLLKLETDSYVPFHYNTVYTIDYLPHSGDIVSVEESVAQPPTSQNVANSPQPQSPPRLYGVTYANNEFIVVGENGTFKTSTDGISWTTEIIDNAVLLHSIASGHGVFVIVGEKQNSNGFTDGVVYTSLDGSTWKSTKLGTDVFLDCVAYGDGTFVVAGAALAKHPNEPLYPIWASHDGMNWTLVHVPNDKDSINSIAYGENMFVGTTILGGILTSPDGITWTERKPSVISFPSTYILDSITYGNNTFVAVGGSSKTFNVKKLFDNGVVLTSSDGMSWNSEPSGIQDLILGVGYGDNTFVAVGSGIVLTSPDGRNWTRLASGTQNELLQVAYGNNMFVIVGDKGTIVRLIANGQQLESEPNSIISSWLSWLKAHEWKL